jgi:hypothetical protein
LLILFQKDTWVVRRCGPTLVCKTYIADISIYCDYPSNNILSISSQEPITNSLAPLPTNVPFTCLHGSQKCGEDGIFWTCVWGKL